MPIFENADYPYPTLYVTAMHCGTVVSFPVSILAGYCIICHSPKEMKGYRPPLLAHLICVSLLEFIFNTGSTPIIFAPHLAGFSNGLFTLCGVPVHFQLALGIALLVLMAPSVTHLFIYRYCAILPQYHMINRYHIQAIVMAIFWSSMLVYVIVMGILSEQDQVANKAYAREHFRPLPPLDNPDIAVYMLENVNIMILLKFGCGLTILVFVSSSILSFLSFNNIRRMSSSISKRTKDMQTKFLYSLVLQVVVLFFTIAGINIVFFALMAAGFPLTTGMVNSCFFVESFCGLGDTLVLLTFNTPYRNAILRIRVVQYFLKLKRKEVEVSSIAQTRSSLGA